MGVHHRGTGKHGSKVNGAGNPLNPKLSLPKHVNLYELNLANGFGQIAKSQTNPRKSYGDTESTKSYPPIIRWSN